MIRETLSLLLSAVLPLLSAPAAPPSSVTQAAAPAALSAPAFDDFYAQRAIWDQNPVDETFWHPSVAFPPRPQPVCSPVRKMPATLRPACILRSL